MVNKEELKKKYKQTVLPMGIYIIKNSVNGKILIGRSKNLPGKLNSIRFQLAHGSYVVEEVQKDYNNYGNNTFNFDTLDLLEPKTDGDTDYDGELKILEEMWLEKLQPYGEKGYNKKRIKK